MKNYMGSFDRFVRIVITVLATYLVSARIVTGGWAYVVGIIGLAFLFSSAFGYLPLGRQSYAAPPVTEKKSGEESPTQKVA